MQKKKTLIIGFTLSIVMFVSSLPSITGAPTATNADEAPPMPATGLTGALSAGWPGSLNAWSPINRLLNWPPGNFGAAGAANGPVEPPSAEFREFVRQVKDGQRNTVRGVFIDDVLAFPVVQQPKDNNAYVSEQVGVVTQFASAASSGVTGLLAHNYLAGETFYEIEENDIVRVVYGNGRHRTYQVTEISQYQKLSPGSLQSALIDLSSGEKLSTAQVFARVYRGEHHLTLQTCLEKDGLANWGLTFIVAEMVD